MEQGPSYDNIAVMNSAYFILNKRAGQHRAPINQTHYQPIPVLFITMDGLLTSDVKFMQIIPVKAIKPV